MKKRPLKRDVAIALDLGGTHLKSGLVEPSGRIVHQGSVPSGSKEKSEKILQRILESVSQEAKWAAAQGYAVRGIGFGIPGILSFPQGVVHRSPQFPHWKDYPLRKNLSRRLSLPFTLDNDANMAALGEGWRGSAKGKRSYLLLTLGTGIGGGIVIDGRVLRGDSGFGGELGHLVIEREGRPCQCGGRGCLEMYASSVGIREEMREMGFKKFPTPEALYRLARQGDKTARRIYENFGKALGAGIASLVNVLDLEFVILGGGLSGAWQAFTASTRLALRKHIYSTTAQRIRLVRARLGNDAGLIGAARSVFTAL
jgi:glucokinase